MELYKYQTELNIFEKATRAAREACQNYLNEHPGEWFPCGFSWVRISPARGKFVAMLKDKNIGRSDSYMGGYVIWNPSHNGTQYMYAIEAGSRAFAEVLNQHGIKASVGSRVD